MSSNKPDESLRGHEIRLVSMDRNKLNGLSKSIDALIDTALSGIVIRKALSSLKTNAAIERLRVLNPAWSSPNEGMVGGEIKTLGEAGTPTFTSFTGPDSDRYRASQIAQGRLIEQVFSDADPTRDIESIFSLLNRSQPAQVAMFDELHPWLPFNFRSLPPGHQIYPHHDNHYRLPIYEHLDARYDRSVILSWFIVLQPASTGGDLKLYGLWGSDPNPPLLPTRFLDTEVLENEFKSESVSLDAGDLVVFNSGKYVHRVTPVEGTVPRVTMGGFATVDRERTHLVYWS
ncbi:MAG: 2OG-Fe(II) oxygenase [Bradymonadia bacterium]